MKKWTMLMMGMALPLLLAGCGYFFSDNGAQADLVFVNGSDAQIASVVVYDSYGGSFLQGCQNADEEAPAEGERWYVAARDSGGDIRLEIGTQWPEDAG